MVETVPCDDNIATLPPALRAAVEAAAVLERFDMAALAAMLDGPVESLLELMLAEGLLLPAGDLYQLEPNVQAAAMTALDEAPERLRELYGRAAHHYAARLAVASRPERADAEAIYMRHLERYCEELILLDETALAVEIATVPIDLVVEPAHQQLLRYYRGLSEGLLDRFDAARVEFDELLAEDDLDEVVRARVLNSGALFAQIQGDYERALDGYQKSYAIWRQLGDLARQGRSLMNQGIVNYYLQDYSSAECDLLAALHLFQEVGALNSQGRVYTNLGVLARDQGRWEESLGHSRQATAIFEREGDIISLGHVSNNIGEVEMFRGHFDAAIEHFERALVQMTTRAYAVDIQLNMGLVRQAQGRHTAALGHYHAALDLAQELGRREVVALVRYRIGDAEQRLGALEASQTSYDAAIEVIEDARTPMSDEGLMINLMGRWQQVYEAAIQLCLARGDVAAAFDYAERARARAFADLLARRGAAVAQERAMPLTAREAQAALPPGTLLLAYFAMGLRGPESAMLDAIPPEATGLRACLVSQPRLLLLALTSDGLRAHDCPLNPNALQASSPYQADGRRFLARQVLRKANDALIAPVADLIGQARRVVVVPHGPLHQLPFAALLDAEGRPLLERAPQLAYAPSATVLLRALAVQRMPPELPCLALGYDGATGQRLRYTEPEAAAVAEICGGEAWRGTSGTCQNLTHVAGNYRWLHLACHGEFDLDEPLRSWLEIGPEERLSAADVIANFKLRADLVTLSACRSGVSKVLRGDEPMGLVRAFLTAGARAVLVTLWPVEDTSARLLMERFYAALLEQGAASEPASALAVAQRYLRDLTIAQVRDQLASWGEDATDAEVDEGVRPYADPAFWAAYALIGGVLPVSTAI